MTSVLLVIHVMVAAALVGVVLLQRSEGGALGIGGGSGFMTGRSAGNALTKTTSVLAACFFATSLALSLLASHQGTPTSVLGPGGPAPVDGGGLPNLQLPTAPAPQAPVAPPSPQAPQSQ
jgi:preprotein translocase subunit SecG